MRKKKYQKYGDWESPFEELITPEEIEQGYTQRDLDLELERKKRCILKQTKGKKINKKQIKKAIKKCRRR